MFTAQPFQFHKGTIKTAVPTLLDILISNFNSIKVRLKQQFQKDPLTYLKFQFHKGTIKTNLSLQKTALYKHFNSIKVRLKRLGSYAGKGIGLFQFHKGTIKRLSCKSPWMPLPQITRTTPPNGT